MTSPDMNEIEQQIALLRSEDDEVWEKAIEALVRIGEDADSDLR